MAKLEADIIIGNIGSYYWHKTTDKLPPVGCYVLGYVNRTQPYFAIVRARTNAKPTDAKRWWNFESTQGSIYTDDEITYWTHLPNAPTQEVTK